MKQRVHDLMSLSLANQYVSLSTLKSFYWASSIIPFLMVAWGIAGINTIGVNWMSLFPLVSIAIWSLFYWIFVLIIQSRKIKKTFELRFLVNGISGLFLSSLFWILCASYHIISDISFVGFDFSLWILFFYVLSSIVYIGLVIFGGSQGYLQEN